MHIVYAPVIPQSNQNHSMRKPIHDDNIAIVLIKFIPYCSHANPLVQLIFFIFPYPFMSIWLQPLSNLSMHHIQMSIL